MNQRLRLVAAQPRSPYICAKCIRRIQVRYPSTVARVSARQGFNYKYGKKLEKAAEEWQEKAAEIRSGQQESMLSILEQRGYVEAITESASSRALRRQALSNGQGPRQA